MACSEITKVYEGEKRPYHFKGVATIVTKLFNITKPHIAVFGEKDAQQLAVIRRVVEDLNMDIKVIAAPIVREKSGLAVSSRNIYLSIEERDAATILYKGICHAEERIAEHEHNLHAIAEEIEQMINTIPGCCSDYAGFVDEVTFEPAETAEAGKEYRLLLAMYSGTVRLIDNVKIHAS